MNETLIKEFIEDKRALGIGKLRLYKYGYIMRNIDALIGKNFDKADISDMKKLVCKIDENEWADWTKYDHKIIIKNFWRWLKKEDNPEEIKWIKPRIRNGNHKLPEELLTQEEIKALIDATSNLKYKLLVSLLYESGARISEILNLKLKHISFDNDRPIAKIVIDGKTGMRRIPIYASLPYLRKYINEYLSKKDSNSFLFYAKDSSERIGYNTIRLRIRWLKKKASINKAVNPHIFRHSRASYLANFLTEAQMKQFFGWTQGSDMCQIYIHMSGRDIDDAMLSKVYGLKEIKDEAEQDKSLKPKICLRCKFDNPATNSFCEKCNLTLDVKTIIEQEEKDKKAELEIREVFSYALKNPKMKFEDIMDKFREA